MKRKIKSNGVSPARWPKHHRATASTDPRPPLGIFVLPGASLMQLTPIDGGVRVVCPGCDATEDFPIVLDGGHRHATFAHEDEDCPILLRIEEALRRYAQITNAAFN